MGIFDWLKKKIAPKKTKEKKKDFDWQSHPDHKAIFPDDLGENSDDHEYWKHRAHEMYQSPPRMDEDIVPSIGLTSRETFLENVNNAPVYDIRHDQTNPPVGRKVKWKIRRGKVVKRDPSTIDGIVVHQTAARFGVSARALRASGGNRVDALARRSMGVACHVMAFADGFVAWPNELDWYIWHGNAFNSKTLGIEIDGDFAGLMDDPSTAYRDDTPDVLTPELRAAACRGIKLLVEEGRKLGMPIKYIYAHRQSSATRRSDPGEQIWKEVVLDYAVKELGLEVKPSLIKKRGYSIPKEWDSENGVGDYWDDPKR